MSRPRRRLWKRRRTMLSALAMVGLVAWFAWSRHANPPGDAPPPRPVWSLDGFRGSAIDEVGRVLAIRLADGGTKLTIAHPDGRTTPLGAGFVHRSDDTAALPAGGFAFASGPVLSAWRPGRGVETLMTVDDGEGFGPEIAAVFVEEGDLVCGWTRRMLSGLAYTKDSLTWSRWDAATLRPLEGRPPAEWDGQGSAVMRNVRRAESLPRGSMPEGARWVSADFSGGLAAAAWLQTRDSRAVSKWRLRTYETGVRLYRWTETSWTLIGEARERSSRLVDTSAGGFAIDLHGYRGVRLSPGCRFLLVTGDYVSKLYELPKP